MDNKIDLIFILVTFEKIAVEPVGSELYCFTIAYVSKLRCLVLGYARLWRAWVGDHRSTPEACLPNLRRRG